MGAFPTFSQSPEFPSHRSSVEEVCAAAERGKGFGGKLQDALGAQVFSITQALQLPCFLLLSGQDGKDSAKRSGDRKSWWLKTWGRQKVPFHLI